MYGKLKIVACKILGRTTTTHTSQTWTLFQELDKERKTVCYRRKGGRSLGRLMPKSSLQRSGIGMLLPNTLKIPTRGSVHASAPSGEHCPRIRSGRIRTGKRRSTPSTSGSIPTAYTPQRSPGTERPSCRGQEPEVEQMENYSSIKYHKHKEWCLLGCYAVWLL
jgi:hypothetical protein